jgi:hypothetical protein
MLAGRLGVQAGGAQALARGPKVDERTIAYGTRRRRSMTTEDPRLTRAERIALAAAALRGVVAGVVHALVTWLIDAFTDHS